MKYFELGWGSERDLKRKRAAQCGCRAVTDDLETALSRFIPMQRFSFLVINKPSYLMSINKIPRNLDWPKASLIDSFVVVSLAINEPDDVAVYL
jgi:hypothetical protein